MKKLAAIAMIAFLMSCKEEGVKPQASYEQEVELKFDEKEKLISFNSPLEMTAAYEELKELKDPNEVFEKYYDKGFLPLRPSGYVSEERLEALHYKKQERLAGRNSKTYPKEDLIVNDVFANLLNEEGEIQVGDKIYKYTDQGLYFTDKKNRELLKQLPLNQRLAANKTAIGHYVPNRANLPEYKIVPIDDCGNGGPNDIRIEELSYYDCGNGGGGGSYTGGGSSTASSTTPPSTEHYNVCVNTKDGWIDNIFGKSYACEYKFNSKKKLRTVFAAEDFYFFTDVYAQAKFKQKTWLGWFSDRDADIVYLKNKKVVLKVKERTFEVPLFYTKEKDVIKIYNQITAFFTSKPKSTIQYISNVYDIDNKTTKNYQPTFEELIQSGNNGSMLTPAKAQNKPFLDIDVNLKNLFGQKVNKAIVINVMGKEVVKLTNAKLLKMAADALKKNFIKLDKNQTGGIAFVGQDPQTKKITPLAYSVFGETVTVKRLAIARRTFDIPSNTKLDKLVFAFSNKGDSRSYGIGFKVKWNVVNSVDIEIESGAKYGGKWGGSKFKVKY